MNQSVGRLIRGMRAGIELDSVSITAAGGGRSTVRGPSNGGVVECVGAELTLQGLAVEARGRNPTGGAVTCRKGGRVTLRDCTLANPGGKGLYVGNGGAAAATMDGGAVAGCKYGVYCRDEGSSVTVRRPTQGRLLLAPRVFMAETKSIASEKNLGFLPISKRR